MKEDKATVMTEVGPDLFVPPHVLPVLMELFAGKTQQALSRQEELLAHLTACHYCRTAVVVLLGVVHEYDRRNNDPQEPAQVLLMRFVNISNAIESHEYERLGEFAETIVAEGRDKANQRFPDVVAHLSICPECRSALEATVAFITGPQQTG